MTESIQMRALRFMLAYLEDRGETSGRAHAFVQEALAAPEAGANTFITPEMLAFLHGCGTLENVWFGDPHPVYKGVFWWRRLLPPVPVGEEGK